MEGWGELVSGGWFLRLGLFAPLMRTLSLAPYKTTVANKERKISDAAEIDISSSGLQLHRCMHRRPFSPVEILLVRRASKA